MNNNNPESEDRNVELSISEVQSSDPNQPVTIDVEAPNDDLAERMENAFDRNLANLIKDVQAPPPPVKIKKPKKVKQVKIKKATVKISRYQPTSSGGEKSFALFLGRKIASSFSLAATARKNAKASGEPARKAGHFLKQALGFEFGGDLLNRTRGSFSSDPSPKQDPSLSKGERFAATLSGISRAPSAATPQSPSTVGSPYTQPSLFDTKKYTSVVDVGIGEQLKQSLRRLQGSFKKLDKSLSNLSKTKQENTSIKKQENTLVETLSNKFVTVSESIKENNVLKKTFNKIRSSQLNVLKKGAQVEKSAAQEAALEQGKDNSGFVKYKDPYKNQQGLLGGIIDLIVGKDYEEDDCDCDLEGGGPGGGGLPIPDYIDEHRDMNRRRGRRLGSKRRWVRRKINQKVKPLSKPLQKPSILKKAAPKAAQEGLEAGAKKGLGKLAGKTAGKLIPGVGAAVGIAEGAYRISQGDVLGGLLSFGSAIPILGWGFTAVDVARELGKDEKPTKKMAEGGTVPAMVGEAGPELITSPNNPMAMSSMFNPATQSIAAILGATDKVVSSAGPSAGAVKPFIQQIVGPLAKIYGKENYNFTTTLGRGLANVKEPDADGGIIGFFKKIIKFITGNEEDSGGGSSEATTTSSAASDAGAYKDLLDMIAGVESTSSGGYEAFNRGGSAGGTVAHGSGNSTEVPIGGVVKSLSQRTVAEVMRLQAAGELHATGRYQIIQSTLSGLMNGNYGDTGVKPTDLYDAVTQDKLGIALIKYRLKTGATPSNFRSEWVGLQKVPDDKLSAAINNANVAYQANPNATAVSAPSGGSSSPPPQTAQGSTPSLGTRTTRAVGDSIAQGVSDASGGGVKDHATSGHNPQAVLANLKNAGINKGNTGEVVLSTGLSNDPSMKQAVLQQMSYLQGQGIPFTVLPVSNQISERNGGLNTWLAGATRQAGGTFASGASFNAASGDTTQAHPSSYINMLRSVVQSSR